MTKTRLNANSEKVILQCVTTIMSGCKETFFPLSVKCGEGAGMDPEHV
jgi:hypothetical protein